MLASIRQFFAERQVLEVETPLLCRATGTDPQLDFFSTQFNLPPANPRLFLQTSPEFAMKRLLAAGSGSIYQICKAFRNGETGRSHNPEFSILEWYRLDFDLPMLMREVAELVKTLLLSRYAQLSVVEISYQQIFYQITGLDPLVFDLNKYQNFAREQAWPEAQAICAEQHAIWLDFLFSHAVQPALSADQLWLIHSYPAIQSSLARVNPLDCRVADRFEVLINGMELGNGFFELADPLEQAARFEQEIAYRALHGLPVVAKDEYLLDALAAGLPNCSGIAIGIDRLLMILTDCKSIDEVLAFPIQNA